ncbi:hypothetical protein TNCV_506501 [Trichonephila clavipes]|nr:hypothetical protein TNCV_506501 [Trichonephila clavipes]
MVLRTVSCLGCASRLQTSIWNSDVRGVRSLVNLDPAHSSPLSNHKAAVQAFQDGRFHHFDFVSKCLIATPSLHEPTTNQVVPSPPRTAIPSSTINNYDTGLRLTLRAIYRATA